MKRVIISVLAFMLGLFLPCTQANKDVSAGQLSNEKASTQLDKVHVDNAYDYLQETYEITKGSFSISDLYVGDMSGEGTEEYLYIFTDNHLEIESDQDVSFYFAIGLNSPEPSIASSCVAGYRVNPNKSVSITLGQVIIPVIHIETKEEEEIRVYLSINEEQHATHWKIEASQLVKE